MIAKTAPAVRWFQRCLSSYWILKLKPLQCREASKFCVVTRPSLCGLLEPEVLRKGSTGVGSTCVHLAICTQTCWSVSSEPYPAQPGSVQLAQHTLTAQENLPGFRPAVGAPLLPTWPALTFTMCSMGQKARPKHILGFCSCQTWLGIPGTDTDRQTHDGEFFPCGSSCVLLQAASHSNFATTSLDIFLESLFRLVQILLADSPQDCYQDKKKVFRENGRNSEQPV